MEKRLETPPSGAVEIKSPPRIGHKLSGWTLIVMGVLLFGWAIFTYFGIQNYLFLGEPQRSEVLAGKTEIITSTISDVYYWISRGIWVIIGCIMLRCGLEKLHEPTLMSVPQPSSPPPTSQGSATP
jgi:hypothetical protein